MKSDRTMRRRLRPGRDVEFAAPWGRGVKLVTVLSVLVIIAAGVLPLLMVPSKAGPVWLRWLTLAAVLAVFGVTSLFCVRGFTVKGGELLIQRLFWATRFPLDELKGAHADPAAMKGAFRSAGNGGFLAFTGWFRSRKLGSYRAFVTDPARCVVVEFENRKIVVSPDDPERFVQALGFQPGDERNKR